jgi:hypothetical protein
MSIQITDVNYHRNGSCCNGFHAVAFTAEIEGQTLSGVATVFPEDGNVAVLTLGEDGKPDINMTWRGDHFEYEIREAIDVYQANGGHYSVLTSLEQPAAEPESRKVQFYAYIKGYADDEHCVIMALTESEAEEKAASKGFYAYSEWKAFEARQSAKRWLTIKSIKLELEDVKDRLSRSHRAAPSTIESLNEEQTKLEVLMEDELWFVDWQAETWDDLDWDESRVDTWLKR